MSDELYDVVQVYRNRVIKIVATAFTHPKAWDRTLNWRSRKIVPTGKYAIGDTVKDLK